MNRKQFISTVSGAAATAVIGAGSVIGNSTSSPMSSASLNMAPAHKVKRGVSLYSYQQTMMLNKMSLEDCIRECSDIGAYGIEAIGQVVIKDYPNPTEKFVKDWWDLMDKYGTIPITYTNFHDLQLQQRPMRVPENLEYQTREFKLGRKLGFKNFRMLNGTPADLLLAAIPVAEKMGIWMGLEVHGATQRQKPLIEWVVKQAEKYPETIGFVPDMGIFSKYPRPYAREMQIKAGTLTREIALYIEESYKSGLDKAEVVKKVAKMKPKPGDTAYIETVYRSASSYQDINDLIPILKYCKSIHGKFWEMSKGAEYYDTQITYDTVVPVLMEKGYDGYILSEYEGQRSMEIADVNEIDEIRRQHLMLKRILGA
jgi:hypothetical protein